MGGDKVVEAMNALSRKVDPHFKGNTVGLNQVDPVSWIGNEYRAIMMYFYVLVDILC
jgi:hypothetical protein